MTGTCLQQLAWTLPPGDDQHFHSPVPGEELTPQQRRDLERFLDAYTNLRFGWKYAKIMATTRSRCPGFLEGDDEWVWRAYLYNCSARYHDPAILGALALTYPHLKHTRNMLEALLVTPETDVDSIAKTLKLDPNVVRAYEKLFFNILDRKSDEAFIASVVYPEGRLVEMYNAYVEAEDLGKLMMRAGYNNGVYDVLYLGGFSGNMLRNLAGPQTPQRLESLIMANGYMLARNGWLNQQNNSAGLFNARTLLAAAKQGGEETSQEVSPFQSMSSSLLSEVARVKTREAEDSLRARIAKAQVIEAE